MFRWFEHHQVYQPSGVPQLDGAARRGGFEDIYFQQKPKLNGWFFPASKGSARANLAFLICHGNGGNISDRLDLYDLLLTAGVNVFAFDYRGYGRSEGRPSERGTYDDAGSAYDWLRARGFAERNIIALGESLGGGIASELALRKTVGGLVLQSSFTSIPDLGAELFPWLPVRLVGTIQYDTRNKLAKIKVPVLILHSRNDTIIPFHHGEKNFAAASEPKIFWELSGDHNDSLAAERDQYSKGLEKFFALLPIGNGLELDFDRLKPIKN